MVTKQVTTAAGVRFSVEITGVGAPLILASGTGGTRSVWDPVWPQLSSVRRAVRYDLRGCGTSTDSTTPAHFVMPTTWP